MKITNYRPQTPNDKVVAIFDIEDVECSFDGIIYFGMAYRNWELRRNQKSKGLFVTSKWAYAEETPDPNKKIHHNYVELPAEVKKAFNAKVLDMLKDSCDELKSSS